MKPFRITKLDINNIGPFGNFSMVFPEKPKSIGDKAEIHILTGENGTGKSTILEILSYAFRHDIPKVAKTRFLDNKSNGVITFSDNTILNWHMQGGEFERVNFTQIKIVQKFFESWREWYSNRNSPFEIAFFAYSGYRLINNSPIELLKEIETAPFEKSLEFQNSINPNQILQWLANTISKKAIAESQKDLDIATNYKLAIEKIETTITQIIEKPIQFLVTYEPVNVQIKVDNEALDFNQLPDGLKSIISWLSDLLIRMDRVKWENDTPVFERNFILFLDEIEVHLHPAWQRKILPAIQTLFPNAQIFISTHSPFVIGSVDGAWIHKLIKPNGDTKLAGAPILSEDAKSYRYWLEEVFDIKSEFGQDIQKDLDTFYSLRNALLVNGTPSQRIDFQRLIKKLSVQSTELETIISLELRQLNKRIAEPILL
jgi:predicted ATP-binding protein involved in virulence